MTHEPWHSRTPSEVFRLLTSNPKGLSSHEIHARQDLYGLNVLPAPVTTAAWKMLLRQFKSVVILLLVGAALFSALTSEAPEAIAILCILGLNATLGFFQEWRAERAVLALRDLTHPQARVRRDDRVILIESVELVPGDIVLVEAGDHIPADIRLTVSRNLTSDEAPLTGESLPVEKSLLPLDASTPLADRSCMLFQGTLVVNGYAEGVVVETGHNTELGKIASSLSAERPFDRSPLQRAVDQLSTRLGWLSIGLVAIVFGLGSLRAEPNLELLILAVSVAVAAVPEGLPAIVTIALSLGVRAMAKRNAIVRKLEAIETLGTANVICTDKTGTLTTGRMIVREISSLAMSDALLVLAGCETAHLTSGAAAIGDPTELALLRYAESQGVLQSTIEELYPEMILVPFDSDRKMMSLVRRTPNGETIALVKGASDVIIPRSTSIRVRGKDEPLTDELRIDLKEQLESYASRGMRTIALAVRTLTDSRLTADDIEHPLSFVGLVAISDPPREESREMVERCQRAGIRVIMITGDHPVTALAIAREVSIATEASQVMTGSELAAISSNELFSRIEAIRVFARVTAQDKVTIVTLLRARGNVVAMTGDGVNDAPALKDADIGLSMGLGGTDVAKEASDIIITDDNFATIARAIEFGRSAFDNIRKAIEYLLSGNIGEITLLGICFSLGLTPPLTALQLLWINLLTDGFPALTLAAEGVQPSVMDRPPRLVAEGLTTRQSVVRMLSIGGLIGVFLGAVYFFSIPFVGEATARTGVFALLIVSEMLRSLSYRDSEHFLWEYSLKPSLPLLVVSSVSILAQLTILVVPDLRDLFGLTELPIRYALILLALTPFSLMLLEASKWRRKKCLVAK